MSSTAGRDEAFFSKQKPVIVKVNLDFLSSPELRLKRLPAVRELRRSLI
jgi:hypothetical protein